MSYLSPINCDNTWLSFENILKKVVAKDELGNFWARVHGLSTYYSCDEYKAVYDAFVTKPDAVRSAIYDTMVCALVAGGYWQRMDLFHFFANHVNSAGEALINWKNPGTFDATNFNNPIHTPDQGILYDGLTQYTMHNWIASVNGINYIRDSASQILYIRTNISSAGLHGTTNNDDLKNIYIIPKFTTDNSYIKTNDNITLGVANTDGSGCYVNTRTAAAVNLLYRNKIPIINGVTASIGVPTHKPYTGCYNDDDVAAGFRADQVAIVIYMDGCSQADVTAVSDILNAAMTSLGTNVY